MKLKNRLKSWLFLGIMLPELCFSASGLEQLDFFLNEVDTLQASFEQTSLDASQRVMGRAQGALSMQRPNKFRWDYFEPYKQEIIADGFQVWLYEFDLEQTSVQYQSQALKGGPALLLSREDPLERHFDIVDLGERSHLNWVELTPKDEDSQYIRILIAFQNNQLVQLDMSDKLDQTTRFKFYDIQHNFALGPSLFKFVPPPGTEVFNH